MAGYTVVLGLALLARSALSFLEVSFVTPAQRTMWSWPVFWLFSMAFAVATVLANEAHLLTPAETLRAPRALATALVIGATVGCLTVWSDWVSPAAAARGLPSLHVRGPAAGPFYIYGAILLTVLFHFLPIAVAARLTMLLQARTARRLFLGATIVLVALSEDTSFFLQTRDVLGVESARHALSVAANAAEAILIYRYGLLAGLLKRGTTYLVWHVLWPAMGPP